MRLRVISDLHVDLNKDFRFEWADRELLTIIAGDISGSLEDTALFLRKHFENAIFVGGNHIVYNREHKSIQRLYRDYKEEFPISAPISFLENDYKVIEDTVFIGATLWTDYAFCGSVETNMGEAAYGLNDFRWGSSEGENGNIPLRPYHCLRMHEESLAFIRVTYDKFAPAGKKIVLVLHHGVSPQAIGLRYRHSSLNASFVSDLEEYIKRYMPKLALIVHGHVHERFQYEIGGIPVICNPCGYTDYGEHLAEPAWDKDLVVEV